MLPICAHHPGKQLTLLHQLWRYDLPESSSNQVCPADSNRCSERRTYHGVPAAARLAGDVSLPIYPQWMNTSCPYIWHKKKIWWINFAQALARVPSIQFKAGTRKGWFMWNPDELALKIFLNLGSNLSPKKKVNRPSHAFLQVGTIGKKSASQKCLEQSC